MMPEDAEIINQLATQLGYSLSVEETFANINRLLSTPGTCCFVSLHNSCVTGWIHGFVAVHIESRPFAVIGGLVVDENFRGKGVGKALVNVVKEWSLEKGVDTVRLRSNTRRTEAHEFYRHLGFALTKVQSVFEIQLRQK